MTTLDIVRWISTRLLSIYRQIVYPLLLVAVTDEDDIERPILYKISTYSTLTSAPINLLYYRSESSSYTELYQKCIKEKSIESFFIFLARTLEIISHTTLLGEIVLCLYKKKYTHEPVFTFSTLSVFGVLKPAVFGYDVPQAPKVVKPLPKAASLKQSHQQNSQQSPELSGGDQKKTVVTQKVLPNPKRCTKGYPPK